MLVRDYMTKDPMVLSPGEDAGAAYKALADRGVRQAPVVSGGRLLGVVTDRDLRAAAVRTPGVAVKVESVMTTDPVTVRESSYLGEAARIIGATGFNALAVLSDDGALAGVLTTTDILKGLVKAQDEKSG